MSKSKNIAIIIAVLICVAIVGVALSPSKKPTGSETEVTNASTTPDISLATTTDNGGITEFSKAYKSYSTYSNEYYNQRVKANSPDNALRKVMLDSLGDINALKTSDVIVASAKKGLSAGTAMVDQSAHDPTRPLITSSFAKLTAAASNITNAKAKEQALKIVASAKAESASADAYQTAFSKKYQLINAYFQVVITSNGDLNSTAVKDFNSDFLANSMTISKELDAADSNTKSLLATLLSQYKVFGDVVKSEKIEAVGI